MRDPGNEVEGLRVRRTKTFLFNAYVRDIAPFFFFFFFLYSFVGYHLVGFKNQIGKSRFETHTCVKCFPVACTIRAVILSLGLSLYVLERPGNLTGPKSYFQIKFSRKVGCVPTSIEVHFVSLTSIFTVRISNLLKLTSGMESKTA